MDLTLSESELAFRDEAREWLAAHVPAEPHWWPQLPQFAGSDASTAQPPLPHCTAVGAQVHRPLAHDPPGPQLRPHAPQLFGSVASGAQPERHATWPGAQFGAPGVPHAARVSEAKIVARTTAYLAKRE